MKTKIVSAAVAAAFFMTPIIGFADEQGVVPLVLAKETVPTFEVENFPWDLPEGRTEDVTLPFGKGLLTMPWMEVEKANENSVIINTPELMIFGEVDGEEPLVALKDTEMMVRRLGDAMAVSGYAEHLVVDGKDDARAELNGFEFALTSKGYEPTIAAMKAGDDFDSDEVQSAFGLLALSFDYTVKSSNLNFSNSDRGGIPNKVATTSGPAEGSLVLGDNRLNLSAKTTENTFAIDGPLSTEGEIKLVSYDLSTPTKGSEEEQDIQIGFELSDLKLDDMLWALVDPKDIFPKELKTIKVKFSLDAILHDRRIDKIGQRTEHSDLPRLQVTRSKLTAFEFVGLGLDLSANADVEMEGEQLRPRPKSITASLSVAGLSEFMANAVKAGLLPQSQAILGEGIALQFAKEKADGSLTFDVTTEDGLVSINGNRVAPLPR